MEQAICVLSEQEIGEVGGGMISISAVTAIAVNVLVSERVIWTMILQ